MFDIGHALFDQWQGGVWEFGCSRGAYFLVCASGTGFRLACEFGFCALTKM